MNKSELEELFDHAVTPGAVAAAQDYLAARRERDNAQAALDRAADALAASEDVLCRKLAEAGISSVVVAGATGDVLVTVQVRSYYRVTTSDTCEHDFLAWLMRSGGHDLLTRTVSEGDLTRLCRRLEEEERPIHASVRKFTKKVVRINNR